MPSSSPQWRRRSLRLGLGLLIAAGLLAVIDVMLEQAEAGAPLEHDALMLPVARLAKAYSVGLNLLGAEGPIPEGMSATTGLRAKWLAERHAQIKGALRPRVEAYRAEHGRRPPYWTLVALAREAAGA